MCISCSLRFCHCCFIQFPLRLFILHKIEFPKGFSLLCLRVWLFVCLCLCVCVRDEKYSYLGRIRITKKKIHINEVCHFRYTIWFFFLLRFGFFLSFFNRSSHSFSLLEIYINLFDICDKIVISFFRNKKKKYRKKERCEKKWNFFPPQAFLSQHKRCMVGFLRVKNVDNAVYIPPGWNSMYFVTLYTLPRIANQESSTLLCLANSS